MRAFDPLMSFEEAVKLLMVSFDSTIKANLTVGLPIDLNIYEENSFTSPNSIKITNENSYFQMVSNRWGKALKESLASLPKFDFADSISN